MSKHLEVEITKLKNKLLSQTTLIEDVVKRSIVSMDKKDNKIAKDVIESDEKIDQCEIEIEEDCLKILALHQPVAIDLRYIIGVLKINNDLERIGDLAVNIAERALYLQKCKTINPPFDFNIMAEKTCSMLKRAIDALINMDTILAKQVCKDDQDVDDINREMYQKVFAAIKETPSNAESLIQYLSTSRHLERIADFTTNIAEDVVYMIDGIIIRHRPEEYHS